MSGQLSTFFHVGGEQVLQVEGHQVPLVQGQGVLISDDIRYRVIDVWFSFDGRNGRHQEGLHVFLERTEETPPWPARVASRRRGVGPVSAA